MKIRKELLDIVDVGSNYGRIISCALYLNSKAQKDEIGATVHEQVALLKLKGHDEKSIARKTGFEEKNVCGALRDISNYCWEF